MSKHPDKDFGPIADDYAFFEDHATEAREDVRAYWEKIEGSVPRDGPIRMLDFGCGSGTVTARLLEQAGWPPQRLRLTLVEPVASARRQAVARVADWTASPVTEWAALPAELADRYDVILANHVLYYVPDLPGQLAKLLAALSSGGLFATAIAARTNVLIEFWIEGFRLLDRPVPYYTSEDVEAVLRQRGAEYEKRQVAYELAFPDTPENRMRIVRFLLADYLKHLPRQPLLEWFDRYRRGGQIEIRTQCDHFTVRASARAQSG